MIVKELIDILNKIENKDKTIGIAEWNTELGCYECSNTLAIIPKEVVSDNSRFDNCECDYYVES